MINMSPAQQEYIKNIYEKNNNFKSWDGLCNIEVNYWVNNFDRYHNDYSYPARLVYRNGAIIQIEWYIDGAPKRTSLYGPFAIWNFGNNTKTLWNARYNEYIDEWMNEKNIELTEYFEIPDEHKAEFKLMFL